MEALKHIEPSDILFLDIETVSAEPDFEHLDDAWKQLWGKKAKALARQNETAEELYERAGIYAEFGKIICIGIGSLRAHGDSYKLRIKSFAGTDEKQLLAEFAELLNTRYHGKQFVLCAHNGKEFDFPYIARRMLINGVKLPMLLDIAGKKPWEVAHLDTMELWKFGDFKNFTSLNVLAHLFGIPTPKDDIDGSQVGHVYWVESNLDRIDAYCKKDVITLVQLFLRFKGEPVLPDEQVEYV